MKTTVVGLFSNCEQAISAANMLKNTGFKIIKLSCKESSDNRKNLFEKYFEIINSLFGLKKESMKVKSSENLVAGIFSKNIEKLQNATSILKNAGAIKVFSFENMSKTETKSKELIMKMISLHAKSEIPKTPSIKQHHSHEGLSMLT